MKKKNVKKAQNIMLGVGLAMIGLSYFIFSMPSPAFIMSLQPEFGSVGIALLLIGGVWKATSLKIST